MMTLLALLFGICAIACPLLLIVSGLCLLVRGFRRGPSGVLTSSVALFMLCLLALISHIIFRMICERLVSG